LGLIQSKLNFVVRLLYNTAARQRLIKSPPVARMGRPYSLYPKVRECVRLLVAERKL